MAARRILLIVALALLGAAALADLTRLGDALPWNQLYDFQDFYCAGAALDAGADPYRYEPLHRCEHRVNATLAYRRDPGRVVPAPLPPYDFPPFRLAARVGFATARTADAIAIALALLAAVAGLAFAGVPLEVAALALALPAGYVLLAAGQIVPFALCAVVWCGAALAARRDALAGLLAGVALVEPHLALPVVLCLGAFVPRARLALALALAALAAVAIGAAGAGAAGEYVTRVLPAQAAAESAYPYQYSLTYLLTAMHLPAAPALALGSLSYAAAAALTIWLAPRVARRLSQRALIAYLPAAGAVLGGAYLHMVDLPMAVPAAAVLAVSLPAPARRFAAAALAILSVPWIAVWIDKKLFLASLFVSAALLVRLGAGLAFGLGTLAAVALTIYGFELHPPPGFAARTPPVAPTALAQAGWRAYAQALMTDRAAWLAIKVPTWAALLALPALALAALRRRAGSP